MRALRNVGFVAAVALVAAWPAASQMQMGMRPPDFRGVFAPVVGSGAAYQMDGKSGKSEMEVTIVGKEEVNGKQGYWVEMAITPPKGGQMFTKNLMVIDGANSTIARMIVQQPGSAPMDLTSMMGMANRGAQAALATDARAQAKRVGSEPVTTPAGTFDCEHYKANDGSWDAWLSTKITPWGLVKSTSKDESMVLSRVISNATDHITGTPQKMDMQEMMRQGMGQERPPR